MSKLTFIRILKNDPRYPSQILYGLRTVKILKYSILFAFSSKHLKAMIFFIAPNKKCFFMLLVCSWTFWISEPCFSNSIRFCSYRERAEQNKHRALILLFSLYTFLIERMKSETVFWRCIVFHISITIFYKHKRSQKW